LSEFTSARATVLSLVLLSVGAVSAATNPSPLLTSFLSTEFEKIAHVDGIPEPISSAIATTLSGKHLMDPAYLDKATNVWKPNTGDRLLFAGKAPALWFVYFEQQTPQPAAHLLVLKLENGGAVSAQEHVVTTAQAFSIPALKTMIRSQQYTAVSGSATRASDK
jgi:hypothetical protein